MYRVSDILNPEFARSWHEAVAIVQEIVSQLAPGATIPEPEDLLIDDNGKLQLGFGPDEAQNPVSILATLLKSLLNGVDAPGGLRDLAAENAKSNPALSSVSAFERALAFYERPGRASELQAIAARLRGFAPAPLEPPEDPQAEFDRLREKVAAKAEADEPTAAGEAAKALQPSDDCDRRRASSSRFWERSSSTRDRTISTRRAELTDRVEQKLADTISSGLNKMGSGEAPGSATAAVAAEAMPAGPPEPAKASRPAPATHPVGTTLTEKAGARTPILLPTGSVPLTTGGVATGPAFTMAPASGPRALTSGPRVDPGLNTGPIQTYTPADAEVDPPRITRQQLPRQPEPGDDTGYFDVIVNETGDVERVQLVSPMRRFQERMLMAAAKAWKFRPALLDGQPVRYRMRIAIILSDKP